MKRGELYRVYRGGPTASGDPREHRVFVVISRAALVDSVFSTVICAPVYSRFDGLSTQLEVGVDEGLKHVSAVFCDELVSVEKARLTDYVGSLASAKIAALNARLRIATGVE